MTQHFGRAKTEFYVTAPAPCPYLPGRAERKIFTFLGGPSAARMNEYLTLRGFRRSQNIIYVPTCEACQACVPVRVVASEFEMTRSRRRLLKRNSDLKRLVKPASATAEQFGVLKSYIDARHADGGMADMTALDYAAMVEETAVDTMLVEYRRGGAKGPLVACAMTDRLRPGLSMVYSFFDPAESSRSLGAFMILDHIRQAQLLKLPYVFLGYWVQGSPKMAYKTRFQPLERLTETGWARIADPQEKSAGQDGA